MFFVIFNCLLFSFLRNRLEAEGRADRGTLVWIGAEKSSEGETWNWVTGMDGPFSFFFLNDRFVMKTTTKKRKTKRSLLKTIVFSQVPNINITFLKRLFT